MSFRSELGKLRRQEDEIASAIKDGYLPREEFGSPEEHLAHLEGRLPLFKALRDVRKEIEDFPNKFAYYRDLGRSYHTDEDRLPIDQQVQYGIRRNIPQHLLHKLEAWDEM